MGRWTSGGRVTGRPLDWVSGSGSPTCSVLDDDERWKGAQLADAKKGVFWGKYGLLEKARLEAAAQEQR